VSDRNLLDCSLHCSWLSSWSPHTFLHTLDLMENHSAQINSKRILRLCFLSVFLMGVWWRSSIPWRHHTVLHRKKSNLLIQFNTAAASAIATAVSPGNSYVNIVSITEVYSLVVRSELNLHWNWFHHTWSWCTTIVQPINWTSLNWVGASTSDPFTLYKILWVYYEANSEVTKLLLACLCVFLFHFAHGSSPGSFATTE
jgi:hypothetical protein